MHTNTKTLNGHDELTIGDEMPGDEDDTQAAADDAELSATSESTDPADDLSDDPPASARTSNRSRFVGFVVLPYLALALTLGIAYLKWQDSLARTTASVRIESVSAAKDSTIALLSYQPDTVEKDLDAARNRLTGAFRESYTSLTHDVVIPGAKQKHISAVASVPAACSVSATPNHAVVLLFVDQRTIIGTDEATDTASSVRVTLDKKDGRWLIAAFDPI